MTTTAVTRIEDFLASLPKETLYFQSNPGNAGDALIALGTYQTFQRMGIDFKPITPDDDLTGKMVAYAGGGNLVPYYGQAAEFIRQTYPKVKRLIVLPHTISGNEDLLASFGDNVDILCREIPSYEYVRSVNPRCRTYLTEDMAFKMNIPEALSGAYKPRYPGRFLDPVTLQYYRESLGYIVWYWLRRIKRERIKRSEPIPERRILNCFRLDGEKTNVPIPWDNFDISRGLMPVKCIINERTAAQTTRLMLRFISAFEVVNTNRLHVGIAGAMLGKEVNLYSNSYFKIRAIYELSLKDQYPNIRWMD